MNALRPPTPAARTMPRGEVPIPEWTDDDADDAGFELAELYGDRVEERFDA